MSFDLPVPPRALFVALANDVGMDRLPAALAKLGAACALISPPGFYCAQTRFIERHFTLPRHYGMWLGTAFARKQLNNAIATWHPDIVVPLDDVASNLLRRLAIGAPHGSRLRSLIETSLGAEAGYAAASSRAELMHVASRAGVRLPRFHIVADRATALRTAAEWGYPVVLKAEHTCGGNGVAIVSDAQALHTALTARTGPGPAWRWLRRAGRDWMWMLSGVIDGPRSAPVMQSLIQGVPAMRTVAAWKGHVLTGVSFVAEQVNPAPTGASCVVRHIDHPEMEAAVRRLVEVLGCSGFVSFDFMLDQRREFCYLIEMNPRPIGTTHLGRLFGYDIAAALMAQLQGKPLPFTPMTAPSGQLIALFPKELERDPFAIERLKSSMTLHDVPHDDPAVVAAYLKRLSHIHPDVFEAIADGVSTKRTSGAGLAEIRSLVEPIG
jgi:hypothetical protein